MNVSVLSLNLYGFRKTTLARGAPRPGLFKSQNLLPACTGDYPKIDLLMDDIPHNTSNIAVALGEIQLSELRRILVQAGVGREDRAATLTLTIVC